VNPVDQQIRILIVDDVAEWRENLTKMLQLESDFEIVGAAADGEEGIELAKQRQPHIVLMDINLPGLDGISATEAILREAPYAQVVMMSVESEAYYLLRSMSAGAREFLIKPFGIDELVSTVRRVYAKAQPTWDAISKVGEKPLPGAPPAPGSLAKLIAVYSPKGGVGCTTLAINLATAICQLDPGLKVAVVDCSLQFGGVEVSLNLHANRSIADLSKRMDELDPTLVLSAMEEDARSGLKVLLAPPRPEMADLVTAEHVRAILEAMKETFDYVVIDMGSRLEDTELSVFDLADRVVLVIVPDLAAIRQARCFLDLIEALEYSPEKVLLVLNKSDPRTGISAQAIEDRLKHKVFAEIPLEDRLVLQSVNRGMPYMIMPNVDRRTLVIQRTGAFAQQIVQAFEENPLLIC